MKFIFLSTILLLFVVITNETGPSNNFKTIQGKVDPDKGTLTKADGKVEELKKLSKEKIKEIEAEVKKKKEELVKGSEQFKIFMNKFGNLEKAFKAESTCSNDTSCCCHNSFVRFQNDYNTFSLNGVAKCGSKNNIPTKLMG